MRTFGARAAGVISIWLAASCSGESDSASDDAGEAGAHDAGSAGKVSPAGGSGGAMGGASGMTSHAGGPMTTGGTPSTGGTPPSTGGTPSRGGSGGSGGKGGQAGAVTAGRGTSGAGSGNGGAPEGGRGGKSGEAGDSSSGGIANAPAVLMPVVNAFCATARTCCAEANEPATLDDCEANLIADQPLTTLESGATALDPQKLAECLAAYEAAAATCEMNAVVKACHDVYAGTLGEGEPCSDAGYECSRAQGDSVCFITETGGHTGVCTRMPHGEVGDACLGSCHVDESCSGLVLGSPESDLTLCYESEGLFCDYSSGEGACQPLHELGDPCDFGDACGTYAVCSTTCQAVSMEDEACGVQCRHDLSCIDDHCASPPFSTGGVCLGYWLGP